MKPSYRKSVLTSAFGSSVIKKDSRAQLTTPAYEGGAKALTNRYSHTHSFKRM